MNKGIVLKINHSSVVVLTPDGQYIKCKKQSSSLEIGQEIQFPDHAIIGNKKPVNILPKLVPVMVACALLCFSFFFIDFNKEKALAAGYVNVDSGAKVSLIVNKHMHVIGVKALNDEGKKVVASMDEWKKEPLKTVMNDVISKMDDKDNGQPNKEIILTGTMKNKYKSKQQKLNRQLEELKQNNSDIKVQNDNHSKKDEEKNDGQPNQLNNVTVPSKESNDKKNKKNEDQSKSQKSNHEDMKNNKIEHHEKDHNDHNKNNDKKNTSYNNSNQNVKNEDNNIEKASNQVTKSNSNHSSKEKVYSNHGHGNNHSDHEKDKKDHKDHENDDKDQDHDDNGNGKNHDKDED